ncbi:AAA family ATPase [Rhizobium sp. TH2]|uniref:ATP-binding protein n=1 Tax=Rhizobium sp. TH2 TaxID=2775403 RepID=UPI002158399E|nr:AAA family ATPase [Rhizobium sp. TH2]UVC10526.1 AAA family ATPase [Rhizobium sp. TH2]
MVKGLFSPIQLTGERRQVTALFYDIVGSTELMSHSDAEDFFRSVASLHKMSESVIARHGGFLHQKLGDGGCCYFGYPEQAENAAERAVRASLELLESIRRQRRGKQKLPFRLRVGVATSLVVFSADGNDIIGAAPVLASRLQAEAEPDSVLVADSAFQLTRSRFDYIFLRNVKLKGFDDPIPVWRPLSAIRASDRFTLQPKPDTPMRGREQELGALLSAWIDTCKGAGKSVAIVGDAGIGKSRLVTEFRRRLQHNEHDDIILQCDRGLASQPLHPFIGFLESRIGRQSLQGLDGPSLRDALRNLGLEVETAIASVIADFVREKSRSTSGNIRVTDISGRALRNSIIEAVINILSSGAARAPKLIVVEDVHWADTMTLELLERLSGRAHGQQFLVVQTSRTSVSNTLSERLTLTGLSPAAMTDLVTSVWGGAPPPGLSSFVLHQCDGMPLYADELVLFLKARHTSTQSSAGWHKLLNEGGVSSLNDLLAARLAEAGPARRTAQLASVIGREFSSNLLRHLSDDPEGHALEQDLAVLVARNVIEQKKAPAETYQFRHVLLHEAAYGSLLRSDRRQLHERIARLLIEEDTPSLPAAVVAWQCAEAGLHSDAARFALKAAEASVLRSAMHEANRSLELCAQEVAAMPRHPARAELVLDLLQLRGVVSIAIEGEGSQQARRIYSHAMSLVKSYPSTNRERRFPLYWGWWFTAPNILTQQSRAQVLVEDMKAADDPETRLQSYHCAWATSFDAAQHGFCLDCVLKGIELYDSERAIRNRTFFGGHDAKVCGLGESALSYLLTNQIEACEAAISQCLEWAASTEHVGSIVHGYYYAIVLRRCQGRYDEVYRLGERMLSLAEQNDLIASRARANMFCGWAEAMSSSADRGARRFHDGLALQQQTGTDDNLSMHSDMHSQILERLGRPAEAIAVIDNAIFLGRKSGQRFWLAELHRRRSELGQALGKRPAGIRNDLRRAVQTAESQGAEWLEQRAKRDLQLHFG